MRLEAGVSSLLPTGLHSPLDVSPVVVDYLAGQLSVADAASVRRYAKRQSTPWEHAAEIRQAYGYRDSTEQVVGAGCPANRADSQAIARGRPAVSPAM